MINIVLSAVGTILAGIWIGILLTDKKRYQSIIEEVDGNEYFMKELFFVGLRLIGWLQMDMSSPSLQKKAHKLSEMYGSREAKKLVLTDLAAQLSYMMTFAPVGILLSVIMNESLCLIITLILLAFLIIYVEYDKNDKLQKRHEQILREFPHVLLAKLLFFFYGQAFKEAAVASIFKEILKHIHIQGFPEPSGSGEQIHLRFVS